MRAVLGTLFAVSAIAVFSGCDKPASNISATSPAAQPANSTQAGKPYTKPNRRSEKPTLAQVESTVIEIISKQTGVRKSEITPNIDLKKDLKTDDLDQVELVMEIEDTFELTISDEDAESWHTVGQVIQYVRAHYKP
jgi:acyl carrier protein